MPQVSLYLPEKTYTKVKRAAEAESMSISKWVSNRLERAVTTEWPTGFEKLFGSIYDDSFNAPRRDAFALDAKRDTL